MILKLWIWALQCPYNLRLISESFLRDHNSVTPLDRLKFRNWSNFLPMIGSCRMKKHQIEILTIFERYVSFEFSLFQTRRQSRYLVWSGPFDLYFQLDRNLWKNSSNSMKSFFSVLGHKFWLIFVILTKYNSLFD